MNSKSQFDVPNVSYIAVTCNGWATLEKFEEAFKTAVTHVHILFMKWGTLGCSAAHLLVPQYSLHQVVSLRSKGITWYYVTNHVTNQVPYHVIDHVRLVFWEKWTTEKEEIQQQTNLSFLVHVGILAYEVEEFIFMKEQEHITAVQGRHPAFYKGTLDLEQGLC